MKVYILYRPQSEHESKVLDYSRDFHRATGKELDMISLDTRDGASKAKVWDVTRYPALVALDESGQVAKVWQDEMLPLVNEVSWYVRDDHSFIQ